MWYRIFYLELYIVLNADTSPFSFHSRPYHQHIYTCHTAALVHLCPQCFAQKPAASNGDRELILTHISIIRTFPAGARKLYPDYMQYLPSANCLCRPVLKASRNYSWLTSACWGGAYQHVAGAHRCAPVQNVTVLFTQWSQPAPRAKNRTPTPTQPNESYRSAINVYDLNA